MSNSIDSDKIFIKDVFSWWFRVPDYQRPYVWGTDQVNNLLDDVSEWGLSRPDSEYFLGSIVLQRRNDNGITEYDLLDGQQRLTTWKYFPTRWDLETLQSNHQKVLEQLRTHA